MPSSHPLTLEKSQKITGGRRFRDNSPHRLQCLPSKVVTEPSSADTNVPRYGGGNEYDVPEFLQELVAVLARIRS